MKEIIDLVPVKKLSKNYTFIIPDYQRGYRWDKEQVERLLDDFLEYDISTSNSHSKEIYCMQPLVVKSADKEKKKWRVIDGQQRLTTLYILLKAINPSRPIFSIEYLTRSESGKFLEDICIPDSDVEKKKNDNPDYYYMWEAKKTIIEWISKKINYKENEYCFTKEKYYEAILTKAHFIWYKIESDETEVFKRLNIGKISLTESELVKALFLNENNFLTEKQKYTKDEIADEWDMIEYRLQDDRFWLFFHGIRFYSPTRIDFILDLVRRRENNEDCDEKKRFQTFEFFYQKCKNTRDVIDKYWKMVLQIFNTLEEWYNDEEIYHYIGFLSAVEYKNDEVGFIKELIDLYLKDFEKATKSRFINDLKKKYIKKKLFPNEVKKLCEKQGKSYLDFEYEGDDGHPKTQARPLLLFHNVQTILDQNKCLTAEAKYRLSDFYRFPLKECKSEHLKSLGPGSTFKDVMEHPKWYPDGQNENYASSTPLKLDSIKYHNGSLYIFDAKYYVPSFTQQKSETKEQYKISDMPGVGDITKQYLYQLAYKEFSDTTGIRIVSNAFLMPKDDETKPNKFCDVKMNMFENLKIDFQNIQVLQVSAKDIFDCFLKDKSFSLDYFLNYT